MRGQWGCALNKLSRVWLEPSISLQYCIEFDHSGLKLTGHTLCILVNNEV